jgi:cyclase
LLFPRIIPCLLIKNKGLVKTVNFEKYKYIGDPLNAVKIFNEKSADELIVLDIDASVQNQEPNYNLIFNIAMECQMPLCYGGGIKTKEQALRILGMGVEKIAISSALIKNPILASEITETTGSQSLVLVIDLKKRKFSKKYDLYIHNGSEKIRIDIVEFVKSIENYGCGEVIVNSIDRDGTMSGYDFEIFNYLRKNITVPMTIIGGASSFDDFSKAIENYGIVGVSAGSLFVFKGPHKAVLINYPDYKTKEKLIKKNLDIYASNITKY